MWLQGVQLELEPMLIEGCRKKKRGRERVKLGFDSSGHQSVRRGFSSNNKLSSKVHFGHHGEFLK